MLAIEDSAETVTLEPLKRCYPPARGIFYDKYLGGQTMNAELLRYLGVNNTIINAIQKSYGEELEELEIQQDQSDLKLILRKTGPVGFKPHVLTIQSFFEKKTYAQIKEAEIQYGVTKYNCRDVLEFMPDGISSGENLVINGAKLKLCDSLYKLLSYLAKELKKTEVGWVYIQDLKEAKIIPSDGYQPFSRLRSAIAGYLLEKNPKDFLESNGRKQYRLSIDPKNIIFRTEVKTVCE